MNAISEQSSINVTELRERLYNLPRFYDNDPKDFTQKELLVSDEKGCKFPCIIYTPTGLEQQILPVYFYVPGTAFVSHDCKCSSSFCERLCKVSKSKVILIKHRVAPENRDKTALNDCKTAVRYLLSKHQELYLDKNKVTMSGYSSGGNFAISVTLAIVKEKLVPKENLRGMYISPYIDLRDKLNLGINDCFTKPEFMEGIVKLAFDPLDYDDPEISPINLPDEDLLIFPESVFIVGEKDGLKHQSIKFSERFAQLNIKSQVFEIKGHTHALGWRYPLLSMVIIQYRETGKINSSLTSFKYYDGDDSVEQHFLGSLSPIKNSPRINPAFSTPHSQPTRIIANNNASPLNLYERSLRVNGPTKGDAVTENSNSQVSVLSQINNKPSKNAGARNR